MSSVRSITFWGMGINALLTGFKLLVGVVFHSHSCIADGAHSLSDFLTDIVVLVGERFWSAPADGDHPHGHQRIEALITAFIGLLLGCSAIWMCVNAIEMIASEPRVKVPGWPVFWVALVSIFSKEVLYQWTARTGHHLHSTAVVANAWHHRSDAISSIPVALVALAGHFWPNITFLDPVAAILVACMLLHTAWGIAWPCLQELSDQGVSNAELQLMRQIASSIPGVDEVHELRTRRLGEGILLDMHILVNKEMSVEEGHRICEEAASSIQHKLPRVLDVMTHLEPSNSEDLVEQIGKIAMQVSGVEEVHSIRVRKVLAGYDADLHVLVRPDLSVAQGHDICTQVQNKLLQSTLKIVGVLTHLEPYQENKG